MQRRTNKCSAEEEYLVELMSSDEFARTGTKADSYFGKTRLVLSVYNSDAAPHPTTT